MTQHPQSRTRGPISLVQPLFLLILVLILAACGGRPGANEEAEQETASPFIGDISSAATATGQIDSIRRAELALGVQGIVTTVNVRTGDIVSAGDLLLALDTSDTALNIATLEQSLAAREADLAALSKAPNAADVAAAEANLASAIARLEDLVKGPDEIDIALAEVDVRSAEASVASAQASLSSTLDTVNQSDVEAARAELVSAENALSDIQQLVDDLGDFSNKSIADQLRTAENNYNVALAKYNRLLQGADPLSVSASSASIAAANARVESSAATLADTMSGSSTADIAAAEATVASAQASLSQLLETASDQDLAIAQAQVEQARLSLADAEQNLIDSQIVAPFDGTITAVNYAVGETASGIAIEMADHNSLEIVLNVDEIDIGAISIGQPATISLETWREEFIGAEVKSIAPTSGASSSGIVSYDVHLELDETDLPVRLGMTANADLITANRENVLLVPNRAIEADRQQGRFYVNLQIDEETIERIEVAIGLRDSQFTQIVDGVDEGDTLLINFVPPTTEFGGGPFGGDDDE